MIFKPRNATLLALLLASPAFPQLYTINTVAGSDRVLDGNPATTVPLRDPTSVAIDATGTLYVADTADHRIRRISPSGTITTLAGTGVPGFSGDRGPASAAQIDTPGGLALDTAGNLYFADRGNHMVRRISSAGAINTVAGTGSPGFSGDGGAATAAQMRPSYVALDPAGNVYVAETVNFRIRKIDTKGIVSTVAGSGRPGSSGDNGPAAIASIGLISGLSVDANGNVYISDLSNALVRKVDTNGIITPFAGSGQRGFVNDGIQATKELMLPAGVAFDAAGNTYIADVNLSRIIKVNASGVASTVAGNTRSGFAGDDGPALQAQFEFPDGLAATASGDLYIADPFTFRVRKLSAGIVRTVAGTSIRDGGPASAAFLSSPDGVAAAPSGQLAVADQGHFATRTFTAGGSIKSVGQVKGTPSGVAFDATGALYVSDDEPYVLKITTDGFTSIVAGNGNIGFSGDGGAASSASLRGPTGVALDSAGNLFIADYDNQRVRKVLASTGTISTVAGSGRISAFGDEGSATSAGMDPIDVAIDGKGNLYIADFSNDRVRKVSAAGIITTVAGTGKSGYDGDGGPATLASLNGPSSVALDAAGNLYIADNFNSVVRRVNAGGLINTIAGNGATGPFSGDGGFALKAPLDPWKLAVDGNGIIYVSDASNDRVRALTPRAVQAASLFMISGNNQSTTVGLSASKPLVVKVADNAGAAIPGVTVTFAVTPVTAATLPYPQALTLGDGTISMTWTAGPTPGPFTVSASSPGLATLTFNLTAVTAIAATAPRIATGGIIGAGLSVPAVKTLSGNAIATIFGSNFADPGTFRQVGPQDLVDGKVPLLFAGVCVLVGNQRAPVFSVYPNQINFQVPNVSAGVSAVQVLNKCGTPQEEKSGLEPVVMQAASPEFFYFAQNATGRNPVAALNAVTGAYVGVAGLVPGASFTPAKSNDYLTLFATGFGATGPSFDTGELPASAAPVTGDIAVFLSGVQLDSAKILYAGVTQNAGLYQLNIQLPDNVPDGDLTVIVRIGGISSPAGAYITVKN